MITPEQIEQMFEEWFLKEFPHGNIETDDFTGSELEEAYWQAFTLLMPVIEKQNEVIKNYIENDKFMRSWDNSGDRMQFDVWQQWYLGAKRARKTTKWVNEYLKSKEMR